MTTARFTLSEAMSLLGLTESPLVFYYKQEEMGVKAEEIEEFPVLPYEPTAEQRSAAFWMVRYVRDNGDFRGAGVSKIAIKFTWNVVPTRGKPYKKILRCGLEYYGSTLPVSFSGYAVTWSAECVYETDVPPMQRVVMFRDGEVCTRYRYDVEHPMCEKLIEVLRIMGVHTNIMAHLVKTQKLPGGVHYPYGMYLDARVAYNIITKVPDLTDDQNTAQYDRAKYEFVKGYLGEDIARKYFRRVFEQIKREFFFTYFWWWAGVDSKLILRLYEASGQKLIGFYNTRKLKYKYLVEFWINQTINYVKILPYDQKLATARHQLMIDTMRLMEQCNERKLFTWRQLRDMSRRERLKRLHDLLSYALLEDNKRNAKKKYKNAPNYQYNDMCVEIYTTVRDIVLKYDPTATVILPPSPLYIVCMGIDQKHCVGSYVNQHCVSILILDIVWHGNASACGINIYPRRTGHLVLQSCSVLQWFGVSNTELTPETDSCVAEINSVLPGVYSKYKPLV